MKKVFILALWGVFFAPSISLANTPAAATHVVNFTYPQGPQLSYKNAPPTPAYLTCGTMSCAFTWLNANASIQWRDTSQQPYVTGNVKLTH